MQKNLWSGVLQVLCQFNRSREYIYIPTNYNVLLHGNFGIVWVGDNLNYSKVIGPLIQCYGGGNRGVYHIPKRILDFLAKENKIVFRGKPIDAVIEELEKAGLTNTLEYLENEFRFAESTKALTICKTERWFPDSANTAEKFINKLIKEKKITSSQVGTLWERRLNPNIKLCGIIQDGSDVFIRMVEEKIANHRRGWKPVKEPYALISSAVIHFNDQVVELRCSYNVREHYLAFIKELLGFPANMKNGEWSWLTLVTKEEAKMISELLSANLSSSHISIPSTVGSLRFYAKKDVNLREDKIYNRFLELINNELKLPTDETLDETCTLTFTDPVSNIVFTVVFEINILSGGFRFLSGTVSEKVIDHILEAFIKVYTERCKEMVVEDISQKEIAAAGESPERSG